MSCHVWHCPRPSHTRAHVFYFVSEAVTCTAHPCFSTPGLLPWICSSSSRTRWWYQVLNITTTTTITATPLTLFIFQLWLALFPEAQAALCFHSLQSVLVCCENCHNIFYVPPSSSYLPPPPLFFHPQQNHAKPIASPKRSASYRSSPSRPRTNFSWEAPLSSVRGQQGAAQPQIVPTGTWRPSWTEMLMPAKVRVWQRLITRTACQQDWTVLFRTWSLWTPRPKWSKVVFKCRPGCSSSLLLRCSSRTKHNPQLSASLWPLEMGLVGTAKVSACRLLWQGQPINDPRNNSSTDWLDLVASLKLSSSFCFYFPSTFYSPFLVAILM